MSDIRRLFVCALAMSPTGTMGGNSKITLELARYAAREGREVHFLLQPGSVIGAKAALGDDADRVLWHVVASVPSLARHPLLSLKGAYGAIRSVFQHLGVGANDDIFCCSDVHFESLAVWRLKKEFHFFWIATFFLFLPGPIENLVRHYRFPFFKYIFVYAYQHVIFRFLCARADAFMITNDVDRRHFPARFKDRVFAMYGGVNVDQIPSGGGPKTRDVVFCSRLHPQKGIDGFLDIWRDVVAQCPGHRLTVIGNGAPAYEAYLRHKAEKLGISATIDWLGYVNESPKYEIYCSARIFVHPTVYDNNGMVAAEALCSGLAVVMFDLPALREVYDEGCVKVPYGDKQVFAATLVRLLDDNAYYTSVRPSPEQVVALRAHWTWRSRMTEFASFVEKMRSGLHG